jgi:hypothetical protein
VHAGALYPGHLTALPAASGADAGTDAGAPHRNSGDRASRRPPGHRHGHVRDRATPAGRSPDAPTASTRHFVLGGRRSRDSQRSRRRPGDGAPSTAQLLPVGVQGHRHSSAGAQQSSPRPTVTALSATRPRFRRPQALVAPPPPSRPFSQAAILPTRRLRDARPTSRDERPSHHPPPRASLEEGRGCANTRLRCCVIGEDDS